MYLPASRTSSSVCISLTYLHHSSKLKAVLPSVTGDSGNVSDDFTITGTSTSSADVADPAETDGDE